MRRRALLAGIGALSAGCLGTAPPRANRTASSTSDSGTPTSVSTDGCNETTERPTGEPSTTAADGEYRLADLSASTSVDRPSVRYVLEPSAFYSGDAVEREAEETGEEQVVRDVSELEDDVRTAVETAVRTGDWRSDSLPNGLADTVQRVDFFTGVAQGGTYTHVGLTLYRFQPDRPPAVAFSARIVDEVVSQGSPGVVEFELTNRRNTTQYVFSGTVPPFGMLFAESAESDDRFLLWRAYEDEGCIRFTDDGWLSCDIGEVTELEPCESVSRRYQVLPSDTSHYPESTVPPGPGTYRVADSIDYYEERGAPESRLAFEVDLILGFP